MRRTYTLTIITSVLVPFLAITSNAQFGAAIQGTVSDQSGAVVKDATVVVTNQSTGVSQTTVSGDAGFYKVVNLAPGKYSVKVDASSFKTNESMDVEVTAESVRGLNVVLQPGPAAESVTVFAGAEAIETENANLSGTLTTQDIVNLPQIGRDPFELIRLTPGVFGDGARNGQGTHIILPQQVGPGASDSQIFQVENQPAVIAKGQRVSANNIVLDGVSANSLDWGGAAVITPNQDSVAEETVLSSSYSAEDGRNSGATIKVISKNGTNSLHGSGFVKFNDAGLNAFNKFAGANNVSLSTITCYPGTTYQFQITAQTCPQRVQQKYRQFGASLGGPILKDKLFFFFSYEGVRLASQNLSRGVTLDSPAFDQYVIKANPNSIAAKIFSTPGFAARIVNTQKEVDCCSLDGRPLGEWYAPGTGIGQAIGNGPDGIPDWGVYDLLIPSSHDGDQFNGRLDYHHNKDQFFFSTYSANSTQFGGGNRPIEDVTQIPTNWIATVGWTRTLSSTLLNEFRANVTRWHYDQTNPTGTTNWGIPQIRLFDFDAGGFGDAGRIIGAGRSSTTPGKLAQNTFAFRDTMSWVRSRHAFKFGFEVVREQNNNDQSGGFRPDYQFRGLLNLANDACCFFEEVDINPNTGGVPSGLRHYRTGDYALFMEDSWKFHPNLTFTLGLRWEYFSPLTEAQNLLTNYVFGSNGFLNGAVQPTSQLYQGDKNNFGPRLAVAWSPTRSNGRLVLRSGFGILYNRYFGTVFSNVRQNTPFFADASSCCFFDPTMGGTVTVIGQPPGSNILYQIGSSASLYSYAGNPAFAHGVAPDGALCANAGCTSIQAVDLFGALPQEPNPYVYAYSGEVQWEFARNYVLTTGYYGSRSRKLVRTIDLNRLIPGDTFDGNRDFLQNASADGVPCGPTNPACPAPVVTGNNRFNRIFFPLPDVNASYDSLVTTVRHRFSRGLEFSATYTWAHSIDTASYEIGYQQTDPSNQLIDKGNSDYDVRHYFVAYAVWEVPFLRNRHDALGSLLGGWSVSPIFTKHSGFPYTALIGACNTNRDRNGDSYCPDLPFAYTGGVLTSPSKQDWMNGVFPNPAASFPNTSPDYGAHPPPPGTFGPGCRCRNIFSGPGFTSVDMTAGKQFSLPNMRVLGEGAKIDIHANFYNLFNILNLAPLVPATAQTDITNTGQFGKTPTGLAGRVVELQARFSF